MPAAQSAEREPATLPAPVVAALVDAVTARVYGRPACRCTRAELTALRDRLRRLATHPTTPSPTTPRTTMTTTDTTRTPATATGAGVPPVQLAALAVLAERADNALETVVRHGAGVATVRAAQDYADAAETRLHRALLMVVPGYGRDDLDRAIDAGATAAARMAR